MPRRKRPRNGPGEEAKQRRSDAYGMNVGRKQLGEGVAASENRLGVFNDFGVKFSVAVPLPVATRGVGFSAAVEYAKICATSNLEVIREICTIFQYYRVALHLVYYKLYLARCAQFESMSVDDIVDPFVLDEKMRQILAEVRQVPISTYNIICSIGKIESPAIWHSVPFQGPPVSGEQAALYLYPTNIRKTLTLLADPNSDRNYRQQFHAHNPLPGARWEEQVNNGWVLLNADQMWPADYNADTLAVDVRSYRNVLHRSAGRELVRFLRNLTWNGIACKSGTVSLDPVQLRLRATFLSRPARRGNRRDALGRPVTGQQQATPIPEIAYQGDLIQGIRTNVLTWSPNIETSSVEMIAGAASLVGENAGYPTRLQIQGKRQAHISPTEILYKLVDWVISPYTQDI